MTESNLMRSEALMGSLLRRSLKSDTSRMGIYLILGGALFFGTAQAFVQAIAEARVATGPLAEVVRPGTQRAAPRQEIYLPPAAVEYPFF